MFVVFSLRVPSVCSEATFEVQPLLAVLRAKIILFCLFIEAREKRIVTTLCFPNDYHLQSTIHTGPCQDCLLVLGHPDVNISTNR